MFPLPTKLVENDHRFYSQKVLNNPYDSKKQYFLKKELANRYRVSASTIERWVYHKNLPSPIRVGPNRILWDIEEILDWEQSRKEDR